MLSKLLFDPYLVIFQLLNILNHDFQQEILQQFQKELIYQKKLMKKDMKLFTLILEKENLLLRPLRECILMISY